MVSSILIECFSKRFILNIIVNLTFKDQNYENFQKFLDKYGEYLNINLIIKEVVKKYDFTKDI